MRTSLHRRLSTPLAVLMLSAAIALSNSACQGPTPGALSPEQAAAQASISGSGKIRGVVSESGIDYSVQQAGKTVGDADVYLDNLPGIRGKSRPDGSFELSGVPVGEHFIVAEKTTPQGQLKVRTKATLTSAEQVADIQSLVMRRTGSVTGQIALEGKTEGLLGADVFVAGSTLISKAKDNGAFALINVAEGTYKVTVTKGGYETTTLEVEIKAGRASTLNFDLKKADPAAKVATISGTIVGAGGRPLAGANASLKGPGSISTITDEQGRFELANVPDGDYLLHLYSPGHKLRAVTQKIAVVAGDDKTKAIALGTLSLEVDGEADGRPNDGPTAPPPAPPTDSPASPGASNGPNGPGASASPGQVGPNENVAAGPQVPGVLDHEIKWAGGTPRTTNFGDTLVGNQRYNVAYGQGFSPSRNASITAIAASLSSGDRATGTDTKVSVFRADANGQPEGDPLAAVVVPGASIKKFGLNTFWTPIVFGSPIPVEAGRKYVAVFSATGGENTLLLTNQASPGGPLRISFAELGQQQWLWDTIPDNEGYNFAVFRLYLAQ